jgi:hypothetical protein
VVANGLVPASDPTVTTSARTGRLNSKSEKRSRKRESRLSTPERRKNPTGQGDVDAIWDGRDTEIKTPSKFHAGALNRPLNARQSENFVIALREPLRKPEDAYLRLQGWMSDNPDKEVSILHYYDNNRIEEVPS